MEKDTKAGEQNKSIIAKGGDCVSREVERRRQRRTEEGKGSKRERKLEGKGEGED